MATIRERQPGVWEVRAFTGRDEHGRPTQVSRTVKGNKRAAQRLAGSLDSRPAKRAAGRSVADVLDAWAEVSDATWAAASRRDQRSRIRFILADAISAVAVARLGVADIERWHARMRKAEVGETAIRSRHAVLRASLAQAVLWEWIPPTRPRRRGCASPSRRPARR